MFNLPKEALVNKFIAKSKFYEKANLNAKLQKEFVDKIQKITWKYKLAESTVGIPSTKTVTEIQVFEIELKEAQIPKNVLKVIDKSIHYPILYCFRYADNFAYGISLREKNSVESYYFSNWGEEIAFEFSAIDLEKVYQKLIKAFLKETVKEIDNFQEMIDFDKKIKSLEAEIISLESKMSKEKQFNRKVELNKILLNKKLELKNLRT